MWRIAFAGLGGIGSDGNAGGKRMCEAIRGVLAEQCPTGLIIDLLGFDYRFGDWIGSVPVAALKVLGTGRVCLLAIKETAEALRGLWKASRFDRIVPIFEEDCEAIAYLTGPDSLPAGG